MKPLICVEAVQVGDFLLEVPRCPYCGKPHRVDTTNGPHLGEVFYTTAPCAVGVKKALDYDGSRRRLALRCRAWSRLRQVP